MERLTVLSLVTALLDAGLVQTKNSARSHLYGAPETRQNFNLEK